ncbi:MAG TPA: TetR/AcrR family transcriptional regulator [Acidobacteriota bacterium]|nr:TetR/AcrR family transcriptional regulator [Acidobacteriota bacterium]
MEKAPINAPVGYRRPKQDRSEQTSDRILTAALDLFSQKTFAEVSVIEIARKAGVSVGGFYARFESKEALLNWFDEQLLDRERVLRTSQFDESNWKDATIEEVIHAYLTRGAAYLRKYRSLISRIALNIRSTTESQQLTRAREFNEAVHAPFLKLLSARKDQICHPDPEFAIRFALMAVTAAMREQILFGDLRLNPVQTSDTKLIQECTRMFLNYLGVKD